jgi:hypothetical protein
VPRDLRDGADRGDQAALAANSVRRRRSRATRFHPYRTALEEGVGLLGDDDTPEPARLRLAGHPDITDAHQRRLCSRYSTTAKGSYTAFSSPRCCALFHEHRGLETVYEEAPLDMTETAVCMGQAPLRVRKPMVDAC